MSKFFRSYRKMIILICILKLWTEMLMVQVKFWRFALRLTSNFRQKVDQKANWARNPMHIRSVELFGHWIASYSSCSVGSNRRLFRWQFGGNTWIGFSRSFGSIIQCSGACSHPIISIRRQGTYCLEILWDGLQFLLEDKFLVMNFLIF